MSVSLASKSLTTHLIQVCVEAGVHPNIAEQWNFVVAGPDYKPFLCSSGCMFRTIVLLEGEPLPSPNSLADYNRFSSRIGLIWLRPTFFHPNNFLLPPPCFIVQMHLISISSNQTSFWNVCSVSYASCSKIDTKTFVDWFGKCMTCGYNNK